MRILTDEEVLSLESFLVEDNETTVAVRVENGIKGVGGSNTSGFMAGSSLQISLEELDGGSPWAISALEICAVVNDALYLRNPKLGIVCVLGQEENSAIFMGDNIAYDTYTAIRVRKIKGE